MEDKPVSNAHLMAVYDLMRWGPTSANGSPARFYFLTSHAAKERLKPHLSPGNRDKTMAAPAVAIIGMDLDFPEHFPRLFPNNPKMKEVFAGKDEFTRTFALRNSSLQGAYFIVAARALGLDCGPMSGFDNDGRGQGILRRHQHQIQFHLRASAMAIPRASSRAIRASRSTKRAEYFENFGRRYGAGRLLGRGSGWRSSSGASL